MPSRRPKAKRGPVDVPFPLEGLRDGVSYDEYGPANTTKASNVRARDSIEYRMRGGARPGLSKFAASQINGSNAVQNMLKIIRSGGYSNSLTGILVGGGFSGTSGWAIELDTQLNDTEIAGTGGSPLFNPGGQVYGFDKDGEGSYYLLTAENSSYTGAGSAKSVFKISSTGTLLWSYNPDTVGATPAAMCYEPLNDRVYIACQSWTISGTVYQLVALDASDGSVVWGLQIGAGSTSDMVIPGPDGTIFFGCNSTTTYPNTDSVTTYSIFRVSAAGTIVGSYDTGTAVTCIAYNPSADTVLFGSRTTSTTWTGGGGADANMFRAVSADFSSLIGIDVANGTGGTKKIHSCAFLTDDTFVYGHELESSANVSAFGTDGIIDWDFAPAAGATSSEEAPTVAVGVDGEVYVIATGNDSKDVWKLDGTDGSVDATANTGLWGTASAFLATRAVQTGTDSNVLLTRDTSLVVAAGGTVKRLKGETLITPTNGSGAMTAEPYRINMAQLYSKIYMVDGDNSKIYDLADETVKDWATEVTGSGSGTLPDRPRLITRYRGRIVVAAQQADPHNWHMSRQGNPLDFNTAPTVSSAQQPVSGNNAEAGLVGDIITALVPFDDDAMLFGCDNSIWQMSGDPAAGGVIDKVPGDTGMAWNAWARDPQGIVYFFGVDGVYAIAKNQAPQRISAGRLDKTFRDIDLANNRVLMEWDFLRDELWIVIAGIDSATATTCYVWNREANSWTTDSYPASMGPAVMYAYDSEKPDDTSMLLGCRDGYIREVDETADDDDGTTVTSTVRSAPIALNDDLSEGVIAGISCTLGESSGSVTMKVYVGQTAEQVVDASTPRYTRTLTAGRNAFATQPVRGRWAQIELVGTSRWALESLSFELAETGQSRRHRR